MSSEANNSKEVIRESLDYLLKKLRKFGYEQFSMTTVNVLLIYDNSNHDAAGHIANVLHQSRRLVDAAEREAGDE